MSTEYKVTKNTNKCGTYDINKTKCVLQIKILEQNRLDFSFTAGIAY